MKRISAGLPSAYLALAILFYSSETAVKDRFSSRSLLVQLQGREPACGPNMRRLGFGTFGCRAETAPLWLGKPKSGPRV